MTRKLFSLTLSAFALLLLMGAGVEQSSAALVSKSNGTAAEAAVRQADAEQDQEADRAEPVPAVVKFIICAANTAAPAAPISSGFGFFSLWNLAPEATTAPPEPVPNAPPTAAEINVLAICINNPPDFC